MTTSRIRNRPEIFIDLKVMGNAILKSIALAIVVVDGDRVAAGMPFLEPCCNWIDELGELLAGRDEFNATKQLQVRDALLPAETLQRSVKRGADVVSAARSDVFH